MCFVMTHFIYERFIHNYSYILPAIRKPVAVFNKPINFYPNVNQNNTFAFY